jgi:hypothetical protein
MGEPLLIGSLGAPRDLSQAGVARDGRDLVLGASRLGQRLAAAFRSPWALSALPEKAEPQLAEGQSTTSSRSTMMNGVLLIWHTAFVYCAGRRKSRDLHACSL